MEEFRHRTDVPYLIFTTAGTTAEAEPAELIDSVEVSSLPGRDLLTESAPAHWNAAFRLLAEVRPRR